MKVDIILYFIFDNYDEIASCGENSVDPDLHSFQFSLYLVSFRFKRVYRCLLFKHIKGLACSLCIICSLGQVKLSLDKYLTAIFLSLGKYQLLLFLYPWSFLKKN